MRQRHSLLTSLAAVAVLVSSLAACGGSGSSSHKYGLINDGVITTATTPDNAPFSSPGANGQPHGMLIDLTALIAKRLGVRVVYKETTTAAALSGLTSGQYDYVAESLTTTAARKQSVLFSTPLTWGQNIIMVRKDSAESSIADFDGKRVGVATGSSQADYAAQSLTKAKIVDVSGDSTGLSQLLNGNLDGYAMGLSQAAITMQQHPGLLRIATSALQPYPAAVAFRKNGTALHSAFEQQLTALVKDGTFLKLYQKYFPTISYRKEMLKYWPQLKAQLNTAG